MRVSREERWSYETFKPVTFRSAWPLAERYEALLRVFDDPTSYARRLARRLHATPHRVDELLAYPEDRLEKVAGAEALKKRVEPARRRWHSP